MVDMSREIGGGLLEVTGLAKNYGRKSVFKNVDCIFRPGLSVITGSSGSGKSTFLRILASAERPSAGEMYWDQEPVRRNLKAYRQGLGYAPQAAYLPESLTAREFARHIAALKGLGLSSADGQFCSLCDRLDLLVDADHRISTFSGGMRRRLLFALALLGSPKIIILDEPTAELDSNNAGRVERTILDAAEHATVVITTHNLSPLLTKHAKIMALGPHELAAL